MQVKPPPFILTHERLEPGCGCSAPLVHLGLEQSATRATLKPLSFARLWLCVRCDVYWRVKDGGGKSRHRYSASARPKRRAKP